MRIYDLAKIIYNSYTIADIKKELYKFNKCPSGKLNKTSLSLLLASLQMNNKENNIIKKDDIIKKGG